MKKGSFLIFIFGAILGALIILGKPSDGTYSMTLSYYLLLPLLIYTDELLDKFSIRSILIVLGSLLTILALGSRGAILCFLVFFVLKFVRITSSLSYRKVIFLLTFMGGFIFTLVNLENILKSVNNFLLEYGIHSRSIRLFLGESVHLSGRDAIYTPVIEAIKENPIFGLGIGGDRRVSGGLFAHNFFLEVLANFGVIIGGIIILILFALIFKSLLTQGKESYSITIIWLCLGFVHLMISGSYITDIKFWIFIGILCKGIKNISPLKPIKYI